MGRKKNVLELGFCSTKSGISLENLLLSRYLNSFFVNKKSSSASFFVVLHADIIANIVVKDKNN